MSVGGYAKTSGASTPYILRPCVMSRCSCLETEFQTFVAFGEVYTLQRGRHNFHHSCIDFWFFNSPFSYPVLSGAVRQADIIPWDYDVDLGMYRSDYTRCRPLRQAWNNGAFEDEQGSVNVLTICMLIHAQQNCYIRPLSKHKQAIRTKPCTAVLNT